MKTLVLNVEGMMCKNCKAHVEKAVLQNEGVISALASVEAKNVEIQYETELNVEAIKQAITDAGYEVK